MGRWLGIGKESSYGVTVAPTLFLEVESEGIQDERAVEEIKTIRTQSVRQVEELTAAARGPAAVVANYQDLSALFYYLMGSLTFGAGSPNTHTVPASTGMAARPSLSVEVSRDSTAQTWRYLGSFLTGLQLTVAVDQIMRAGLQVVGKDEVKGTAGTPSWPDLDLVLPKHCTLAVDSAAVPVKRFSVNGVYPISEPHVLGSLRFGSTPADGDALAVSFEAEAVFDTMVEYDKFNAGTQVPVVLTADSGGDETLVLTLSKTKLTQYTPHLDGRGQLVAVVTGTSRFDTTALDIMQAVITNDAADPSA